MNGNLANWKISLGVTLLLVFLVWAISSATAQGPDAQDGPQTQDDVSVAATVNSRMSYQGVLRESGLPVTGSRDMIFRFYSNGTCTTQVGSNITKSGVLVSDGLFSVELDVNQSDFNGRGLWLQVEVGGTKLGCKEVLPAPYALSLRPGAQIQGPPSAWTGAVLKSDMTGTYPAAKAMWGNSATGAAVYGESTGGVGLYGYSNTNYAVRGYTTSGWAGYFSSDSGSGIRVNTNGLRHYDDAGYFTANWGYGLYVESAHNNAIRAVGGSSDYTWQPGGPVGVVGLSTTGRGVFGSSRDQHAVEGISQNAYGVYGVGGNSSAVWQPGGVAGVVGISTTGRGVVGSSQNSYGVHGSSESSIGVYGVDGGSDPDDSFAVYAQGDIYTTDDMYVSDHLFVTGYATFFGGKSGYVVDIAQNDDNVSLQTGDVVVISGAGPAVVGEIPVIQVRRAAVRETSAVAGVVDRHYVPGKVQAAVDPKGQKKVESYTDEAAIASGEYLTVVTLGAYQAIKVDASYGAVVPGDLLVSSPNPGYAMKASNPQVGSVIGKALAGLPEGAGVIPVLITLQ
jgi:hypothetical protein